MSVESNYTNHYTNTCAVSALKEIQRYQRSVEPLIPLAPFTRLVREILKDIGPSYITRMQRTSIDALRESAEAIIVRELESK